ncbi:MAG: hypothetical protein NO114_06255, partial [Sulfolobales archaeon]|nr:hypothetical protein [Sulfolobales archaeon]
MIKLTDGFSAATAAARTVGKTEAATSHRGLKEVGRARLRKEETLIKRSLNSIHAGGGARQMPLVRLKLRVSPFVTTDFTGKFVKTLLINA